MDYRNRRQLKQEEGAERSSKLVARVASEGAQYDFVRHPNNFLYIEVYQASPQECCRTIWSASWPRRKREILMNLDSDSVVEKNKLLRDLLTTQR